MNKKAERVLLSLEEASRGTAVEIGTIRDRVERASDGFSTVYLLRRCLELKIPFHSFDLEPGTVELANEVLREEGLPAVVQVGDGKEILKKLGPVSFLYLDSSDDPLDTLEQYLAAELLPGAVLLVDDVQPYGGNAYGKGTLLVKHFESRGIPYSLHFTEPTFQSLFASFPQGKKSDAE